MSDNWVTPETAKALRDQLKPEEWPSMEPGFLYNLALTVEQQSAQIAAVKALHVRDAGYTDPEDNWCISCMDDPWPCQTARALGVEQ